MIDLKHINEEMGRLRAKGVAITPENLKISDRAMMVLPIHPNQDKWEEQRLGKDHFGSTLRGISPIYGDKYMKKAIMMGDLTHPETLEKHLHRLVDWKNDTIVQGYGQPKIDFDATLAWIHQWGDALIPHLCDAGELLEGAVNAGKDIMFEAQLSWTARLPTTCARPARSTARPPVVPGVWPGWTSPPPATARSSRARRRWR